MKDVIDGLAGASRLMDEAILAACRPLTVGDQQADWSSWEIDQTLRDLERLKDGDCCYDRPSIGVTYALWYHGTRTHDALRMLLPVLERNGTAPLTIVDLGCGTGATACALVLAIDAMAAVGRPVPQAVTVTGVDQSPFMIVTAQAILDTLFARVRAPQLTAMFVATRWEELAAPTSQRTVITAGYLLDHSDDEHGEEIAGRLETLAARLEAQEIIVTTVSAKATMLNRVATVLGDHEWQPVEVALERSITGEDLDGCRRLRARWYEEAKVTRDTPSYFARAPRWQRGGPVACALTRVSGRLGETLFDALPDELEFDEAQRAAAAPGDGPTAIVGPAGSGKTLVLAERIALTITEPRADPDLRILVTAFNKEVVALLRCRVGEALQRHGARLEARDDEGHNHHVGVDGRRTTLWFYNRDKLPTRVFGVGGVGDMPTRDAWLREVKQRRSALGAEDLERVTGLSEPSLAAEFERFIVAKGRQDRASYVDARRPRSGHPLGDRQKEVIWDLVMEPPIPSHGLQRLRSMSQGRPQLRFTHVFVDECQDFGEEELRQLASAAISPERLCIAGDPSQSIHLGPSYRRPTFDARNWRVRPLEGSHRLPLRICEALRPQAEHLVARRTSADTGDTDAVLLGPRKASLLGVRPIVVLAEHLHRQLPSILDAYSSYVADKRVFVADTQRWVTANVESAVTGWEVTSGSMLQYKGCEWPVVVMTDAWKGGALYDEGDKDAITTLEQHVFTVLTRSTRLLVVALAKGSRVVPVSRFLGRLDSDRVLPWTHGAQQRLAGLAPVAQFEAAFRAGALRAGEVS